MNSAALLETDHEIDYRPPGTLRPFFSPKSVAVIGASPKPGNQGRRIVESLLAHGFRGRVTTVHPTKSLRIPSVDTVRSVGELPMGTDLAIAAVPAPNVPGLVEPLAGKGIHHLIVISGGFAETGPAGETLQEQLRQAARRFGVRVIGPNGLGVFSAPDRFNSFFLSPEEIVMPEPGPVAIISQSGSSLALILDRLARLGVGVQGAVNFGNRVDVDECELLELFAEDPAVGVIGIYLESVCDGRRFVEAARRVTRTKPVVIWKGGHRNRGRDATRAHSASLSGSYAVFQAACEKARMLEVRGFEEFQNALQVLAWQPPARGNRILIISNGGGMGVFLTDLCERKGLNLPEPPPGTARRLASALPSYFSIANPVDLTGSGTNEQCVLAAEVLMQSGRYDGLLMVLLAGTEGITPGAGSLFQGRLPTEFPVVAGAYGKEMLPRLREVVQKMGIPVFASGEEAVRAMAVLVRAGGILHTAPEEFPAGGPSFYGPRPAGWLKWLDHCPDEMEIKMHLEQCGVEVPPGYPIKTREDISAAWQRMEPPVVLKVIDAGIKHKMQVAGFRLDIKDEPALTAEWKNLSDRWPGKVWVEKQMPPGLDVLVGAHRDPQFGPVLLFGTGGPYVEIYQDVERLLLPATAGEMAAMIEKTRAGQIILGSRPGMEWDRNHLLAFLQLVADWITGEPMIESLDFNPVRLYPHGLVVLDAKATLDSSL